MTATSGGAGEYGPMNGATNSGPPPDQDPGAIPWSGSDIFVSALIGFLGGAVLIGILLSAFQLAETLPEVGEFAVATSALYAGWAFFGWYFALWRRQASLALAGFKWVGWGPLGLMIPLAAVLVALSFALTQLMRSVLEAEDPFEGGVTISVADVVVLLIAIALVGPVVEEFLFRGLLYRYVSARKGPVTALMLSSLVFAAVHLQLVLMPFYLFMGVVLGWVAQRYESLYPAIALHALNNGAVVLIAFALLD